MEKVKGSEYLPKALYNNHNIGSRTRKETHLNVVLKVAIPTVKKLAFDNDVEREVCVLKSFMEAFAQLIFWTTVFMTVVTKNPVLHCLLTMCVDFK